MTEWPAGRVATPADVKTISNTISLAFAGDPVWGRALAILDGHDRLQFWRLVLAGGLRYPWTWLTGQGATVSAWIPPGGTEFSDEQEVAFERFLTRRLGDQAAAVRELFGQFTSNHPHDEPHYYLSLLATHPDHRGHGLGMRLLAENLARIDAERLPAYLESTNPANNGRYQSVGFEPIGSFVTPYGRAAVTTMWRSAAR